MAKNMIHPYSLVNDFKSYCKWIVCVCRAVVNSLFVSICRFGCRLVIERLNSRLDFKICMLSFWAITVYAL